MMLLVATNALLYICKDMLELDITTATPAEIRCNIVMCSTSGAVLSGTKGFATRW
jgi:hypothetical protein